ncbi:hypothetical protein BRAO375_2040003 [Bradyrhizobium sp. ORS 375]|nr:hypothetical protein BRAO375_2040003 [Bradyrhizobium sp. ORS 375]
MQAAQRVGRGRNMEGGKPAGAIAPVVAAKPAHLCATSHPGMYLSGILRNFAVVFEPRALSSRPTLRDGH